MSGVGAAMLAVGLFDAPARAETRGPAVRPADLVVRLGQLEPGGVSTAARREAAAPTGVPLSTLRPAPAGRSRPTLDADRPDDVRPVLRKAPPRSIGTRPPPAPLRPGVVPRILPPRSDPLGPPAVPAAGPARPVVPTSPVSLDAGPLRSLLGQVADLAGRLITSILARPDGTTGPALPPGSAPPVPTPVPYEEPDGVLAPGLVTTSPTVHFGDTIPLSVSGARWVRSAGRHPAVPVCPPPVPAGPIGSAESVPGDASGIPVAPDDERAAAGSGTRTAVALPPTPAGPVRWTGQARTDVPTAPARGRSPAPAARPG
ncbi:hypothetical protein [Micromonospora pallida]|uniref:hypothetical protein n=1 Tax=Micromonospora pallida TaxID=145854 RepID=UPI000B841670|nr:hypothetical protein [Micromonospora pallida]